LNRPTGTYEKQILKFGIWDKMRSPRLGERKNWERVRRAKVILKFMPKLGFDRRTRPHMKIPLANGF